ncbi:hypothetical protein GCM10028813_09600 [Ramlibacter alkalitolerans]
MQTSAPGQINRASRPTYTWVRRGTMKKEIGVRVDPSFGVAQLLPGLQAAVAANGTWQADMQAALIATAILTSPPLYRPFHLNTFWAWLRYGPAISRAHRELRLRWLWRHIDPHQKTILSDDFGMGLPALYLVQNFAFEDFADTQHLLERLLLGVVSPAAIQKNGAAKLPDFIAIDSLDRLHILECKGTQAKPDFGQALRRGVQQKNNLSNPGIFTSIMVSALFIPQFRSKSAPELLFVDPDPDIRFKLLADRVDAKRIRLEVRLQALAKALSAAGVWQMATGIGTGAVSPDSAAYVRNLGGGELHSAGFELSAGRWIRRVHVRTLEPLDKESPTKDEEKLEPVDTYLTISIPDLLMRAVRDAVRDDGIVATDPLKDWVTASLNEKRSVAASKSLKTRRGNREVSVAAKASSWSTSEEEDLATLTTTADIAFEITRKRG